MSLSSGYAMKKRMKKCSGGKMASGGTVKSGDPEMDYAEGGSVDSTKRREFMERGINKEAYPSEDRQTFSEDLPSGYSRAHHEMDQGSPDAAKTEMQRALHENRRMKGPTSGKSGFAEGGFIGSHQSPCHEHCNHPGLTHEQAEYHSGEYDASHPMHKNAAAMHEDDRDLNQHGEIEEGPDGMAMGGMLTDDGYQSEAHERDMVGRVMAQRQKEYSEGGKVANSDMPEADFMPNEFDDLHLRDNLEEHYTGANSGDEDGDEGEDKRRKDMVSMVMNIRNKRPSR